MDELLPPPGAIVTVFRSRLAAPHDPDYAALAAETEALASEQAGFVSFKSYVAEDGERVAIAVFDSEEHEAAWRDHPRHRAAQDLGRRRFYERYELLVCELRRASAGGIGALGPS